jgi:hypothetical protein
MTVNGKGNPVFQLLLSVHRVQPVRIPLADMLRAKYREAARQGFPICPAEGIVLRLRDPGAQPDGDESEEDSVTRSRPEH